MEYLKLFKCLDMLQKKLTFRAFGGVGSKILACKSDGRLA